MLQQAHNICGLHVSLRNDVYHMNHVARCTWQAKGCKLTATTARQAQGALRQ